jgi:hypothetical protein
MPVKQQLICPVLPFSAGVRQGMTKMSDFDDPYHRNAGVFRSIFETTVSDCELAFAKSMTIPP